MRPFLLLILPAAVTLICAAASGQTPEIEFHRVGLEGANCYARSVIQDSEGFIWFAGRGAINRYDGNKIDQFDIQGGDWEDRSRRWISTLCMDPDGDLWAGGQGGIARFDRKEMMWKSVPPGPTEADALIGLWIRALCVDKHGDIWLQTTRDLARYRKGRGVIQVFRHEPGQDDGLPDDVIRGFYPSPSGRFWIAVRRGNLFCLDPETGRMERVAFSGDLEFPDGAPWILYVLDEGNGIVWVATSQGLIRHDRRTGISRLVVSRFPSVSYLGDAKIWTMLRDSTGRLWVGTLGSGLHQIDEDNLDAHVYRFGAHRQWSLPGDSVLTLFEDRGGVIWVGTRSGLCRFNGFPERFVKYRTRTEKEQQEVSSSLRGVLHDSDGNIWVGTQGKGVFCMERRRNTITWYQHDPDDPASLSHDAVLAVEEGPDGVLWFGTDGGGLNRLDRKSGRFQSFRHEEKNGNSLSSDRVRAIQIDPDGILWIGLRQGLDRFDPESGQFTPIPMPVRENGTPHGVYRNGIYPAKGKGFWIATNTADLLFLDWETGEAALKPLRPAGQEERMPKIILALHDVDGSTLWLGTNEGLLRYEPQTGIFHRSEKLDLRKHVLGLLPDDQGRIWFSSSWYGLFCYDPEKDTVESYLNPEDSSGRTFTPGSCHLADNGEMFFTCRTGLVRFHPDKIVPSRRSPCLVLTGFSVLGKPRNPDRRSAAVPEFDLDYMDKFVSFEFAALDYTDPGRIRHAYRLPGVSDDWIFCGRERQASYSNLGKGTHVFQIKAANADGIWSEPKNLAVLHIAAAPWQTWWFQGSAALLLAGLAWGVWRWRVRGIRALNRALGLEVSKRTEELKATQETLLKGERLAAIGQVTATVSHEIRNPLSTIAASVYSIRQNMTDEKSAVRKPLERIERNVSRCVRITQDLLDFGRIPRFVPERTDIDDWLDWTLRSENLPDDLAVSLKPGAAFTLNLDRNWLGRCLRNLVMNAYEALKGAKAGDDQVTVTVESEVVPGRLEIRVRDEGPGISAADLERIFEPLFSTKNFGTGLGLPFVKQVMELMNGGVTITSRENAGTTAVLWLTLEE